MTRIISTRNKNLSPNNARLAGDPFGFGVMKPENSNRLFNTKATGRSGGINKKWLQFGGHYNQSPIRYVMLNNSNKPIAVALLKNRTNASRNLTAIIASGPKGTGSILLTKIIQNAKNNDRNRIMANVVNVPGVLKFYNKFNFIDNINSRLAPIGVHPKVLYLDPKKHTEAKRRVQLKNAQRDPKRYFTKGNNDVYYNINGKAVPGLKNKLVEMNVNNINTYSIYSMFKNRNKVYFKPPNI